MNKKEKERREKRNARFKGWSVNKLILRANKIISIIDDKGLKKSEVNMLEDTFDLIIQRLQLIAWNDNDMINKTSSKKLRRIIYG